MPAYAYAAGSSYTCSITVSSLNAECRAGLLQPPNTKRRYPVPNALSPGMKATAIRWSVK